MARATSRRRRRPRWPLSFERPTGLPLATWRLADCFFRWRGHALARGRAVAPWVASRRRQAVCVRRAHLVGAVTAAAVLLLPIGAWGETRSQAQVAVALATARRMTPRAITRYEKSGHVEAFGSYRITVPASWEEAQPINALCEWPTPGTPQLLTLRPDLPVPSCAPVATRAVNDGAILFWPGAAAPEPASDRPLLTLRPRTTAPSQVFAVADEPDQLLVRFREGAATFEIAVAVGRDGRVAGRVIASILRNPDT